MVTDRYMYLVNDRCMHVVTDRYMHMVTDRCVHFITDRYIQVVTDRCMHVVTDRYIHMVTDRCMHVVVQYDVVHWSLSIMVAMSCGFILALMYKSDPCVFMRCVQHY